MDWQFYIWCWIVTASILLVSYIVAAIQEMRTHNQIMKIQEDIHLMIVKAQAASILFPYKKCL